MMDLYDWENQFQRIADLWQHESRRQLRNQYQEILNDSQNGIWRSADAACLARMAVAYDMQAWEATCHDPE